MEKKVDHAESVNVLLPPSLQGVVGAVFSELYKVKKGLAELDALEGQFNLNNRSKENHIRRLESLGV